MRAATPTELATLAAAAFWVFAKTEIQTIDGAWQDLSSLQGFDWQMGYDIEEDIDQPVAQATFQFRRDFDYAFGQSRLMTDAGDRIVLDDVAVDPLLLYPTPSAISMSPLRDDSPINHAADGTYQPFVDAGRPIRFSVAALPAGSTPAAGDWHLLFDGVIDTVAFEHEPMAVTARDTGGAIVDAWSLGEMTYGSNTPMETVIQNILNETMVDALGVNHAPTLYTPVSPLYEITSFKRGAEPVMDALQRLVGVIGWDLRFKWDNGTSAFRFTLSDPGRSKTTPDATIAAGQYLDVTTLKIDRATVRNHVEVEYGPVKAVRDRAIAEDSASQKRYGYRPVVFIEADDSPIDTATEANAMRDAILADLKDPKADQSVEMLCFWPAELRDLYTFTANGRHYNSDQTLAVVKLRHRGAMQPDGTVQHRTTVDVRGTPAGAYNQWLRRSWYGAPTSDPTIPSLDLTVSHISATQDQIAWTSTGTVDYNIDGGPWVTGATSPITVDRYPSGGSDRDVTLRATLGRQVVTKEVIVKAQSTAQAVLSKPTATYVDANDFTVDWSAANMPAGTTYTVTWSVDGGDSGTVNPATSPQTVTTTHAMSATPSGTVTVAAVSSGVTIASQTTTGPFQI